MAKTVVLNPSDNTRVPFLRGILTRSVQNAGVPFDRAYRLASNVRRELDDTDEVSTSDLRTIIVRHLQDLSYQDAAERYQMNIKIPAPIMVTDASGETASFSRVRLQQQLERCSLSSDDASDITGIVYDRILQEENPDISSQRLAALTHQCLQHETGADYAQRYLVWLDFSHSGRPLLLLIGGTAATGKSTISTEMASRLEIVRTQSTDMLRQVMRMMIPERLLPVLHTSSFNAWRTLSGDPRDRINKDTLIADGFLQQAKLIDVACEAVIDRAVQERVSLVLEGVHVLPSLQEKISVDSDAIVVPIILGVLKRDHLMKHIKGRGTSTPQRRSERYMDNFEDIWRLQSFILSEADRASTPIVINRDKETTIREFMKIIGDNLADSFDQSAEQVLMQLGNHDQQTTLPDDSTSRGKSKIVETRQSWLGRFQDRRLR